MPNKPKRKKLSKLKYKKKRMMNLKGKQLREQLTESKDVESSLGLGENKSWSVDSIESISKQLPVQPDQPQTNETAKHPIAETINPEPYVHVEPLKDEKNLNTNHEIVTTKGEPNIDDDNDDTFHYEESNEQNIESINSKEGDDDPLQILPPPIKEELEEPGNYDLSGLTGYRIVDINHVLQWAFLIGKHKESCNDAFIEFVKEKRNGLTSAFTFKCIACDKEWVKTSEAKLKVNQSFVWGTHAAGIGFTETNCVMNTMDVPPMSKETFEKVETKLEVTWVDHMTEQISQAGENERIIAIEKGNVTDDGVPFTTVIVNTEKSLKKSNDGKENSESNMACIIGQETKQCIFLGINGKYCYYCELYKNCNAVMPPHQCFKNYNGEQTSVAVDIIAEGFNKSMEIHGLLYNAVITDGDPLYAKFKDKVPHWDDIKKIKSKTVAVKDYTKALHKIINNTDLSLPGRKILRPRLRRLIVVARRIINQKEYFKCDLHKDLKNVPYHVFGKHDKCEGYYCDFCECGEKDEDWVEKIVKEGPIVWDCILDASKKMASKAEKLSNFTTNVAEDFLCVINKFAGPLLSSVVGTADSKLMQW